MVAGSLLFGLPYTGSVLFGVALIGLQSGGGGSVFPGSLFVPAFGPFLFMIDMGKVDTDVLLDGIAQTTGVAMIVLGTLWKKTVIVPNTGAQVTMVPMRLSAGGTGLGLAGSF